MEPVNPASLPPDYWSSLEAYATPDSSHHHSHPPQRSTPQQTQQSPMGISWDHPVLHTQQSHRDQPHHGLYTPQPQQWQQNPLHHQPLAPAPPQNIGLPAQYRQPSQYAQSQVAYDSRSVSTPENAHYSSYSFSPTFYPPQHISIPDPYSQTHSPQPAQQQAQSTSYQTLHQNTVPQYTLPPGFPDDPSHSSVNFANDFAQHPQGISEQTINPQFIAPAQSVNQNASLNNQFVYVNPAEDPNYFPDNVHLQSILDQPIVNGSVLPGHTQGAGTVAVNGFKPIPASAPIKSAQPRAKQSGPKKQPLAKKLAVKKADGKGSVSSDSGSDDSDSDLEILEPEEPSPIPAVRPNDPEAAAQYDVLGAVWFPRNRRLRADRVKSAFGPFTSIVKTVRDTWKESAQALKAAENKGESSATTELRKKVALQRRIMDVVVSTALEKGHPVIVEKLGENPMAVAVMYSFLLDRHQASDIDGTLTLNILKLLARFVTVDEDTLQKTKVDKLLPRFVKKGSPQVKSLAQTILDNAAASTKRKQEAAKSGSKEGSPMKTPVSEAAAVEGARRDISGAKRPRDGEANGQPATKKVVMSNIKSAPKPTPSTNGSIKATQENKPPGTTTTIPARQKATVVPPKLTNLFGSLASASKKPGTSNAERAAAAAAAKTSAPAEKKTAPAAAPSRPAFSFGDIMADLEKPKEHTPKETSESRTPETEEERQKRLRKEARRKLRVTWKPDDSLTAIRYFTHDPDEELGPNDRSRQSGDVKGEGSVLKLHKNMEELEEDDEGGVKEEQLFEYYTPSEIDDADVSPEDLARNFVKRIGTQQPTSPEAKAQEHREATTLMVFYTSPADVPSSAKEPPPPDADEATPEVLSFGELPDLVKGRQDKYYAMTKPQPPPQSQPGAQSNLNVFDILKSMNQGQQQSTPPPQVSQPAQTTGFSLEQTINMLRQQQPQQPAPVPQTAQPPAIDPQIWALLYGQQPAQQPPPPPQQPQQGALNPQLAALIAQFSNQNQNQSQSQHSAPTAPQTTGHYEDPERKRMRESGGYEPVEDRWKRNRMNTPNKKHPKAGSVPCRYWREGKCLKGDDCTFRHDPL
ncbi:hypothetical protein BJY04DRAFT_211180 [Aspergillus karnatakaensis]|uniref:uncharacterized protein n=1 Tax=Aspergillus karnatakaensis TaxID=1810916 RepID=UPI003CCDF92E